jgi:hypothetical protein
VVCKLRLHAVCGGPTTISFKVPKQSHQEAISTRFLLVTHFLTINIVISPSRTPLSLKPTFKKMSKCYNFRTILDCGVPGGAPELGFPEYVFLSSPKKPIHPKI